MKIACISVWGWGGGGGGGGGLMLEYSTICPHTMQGRKSMVTQLCSLYLVE